MPAIPHLDAAEPGALLAEERVAARHRVGVGVRFDQFDTLDSGLHVQKVAAVMHGTPRQLEAGVRATPCSDGEIVSLSRRRRNGDVGDVRQGTANLRGGIAASLCKTTGENSAPF